MPLSLLFTVGVTNPPLLLFPLPSYIHNKSFSPKYENHPFSPDPSPCLGGFFKLQHIHVPFLFLLMGSWRSRVLLVFTFLLYSFHGVLLWSASPALSLPFNPTPPGYGEAEPHLSFLSSIPNQHPHHRVRSSLMVF